MNLLFVIKTMDSRGGGAERVLAEVASALAHRGHRVTVVSFDTPEAVDFYSFDPRVERVKIAIGRAARRSGLFDTGRRTAALRRVARGVRPDAAIGFMHSSFVPLGWALVGRAIPVVASEHIDRTYYDSRPAQLLAIRASLGRFAAITIPTAKVRAGFEPAIRRKMTEVPNPVAVPGPSGGAAPAENKVLLSVGRLAEQKDHRTLVDAFAHFAARHPDWQLRIAGEGELRGELEAQVERLGLGDRIVLPGASAAIDEEYRRAGIFVLPSIHESFGLATAEALAHGLPAVGFADCAGTNELIEDGVNGLLVEGSDRVFALADALDGLISAPQRRALLGAAGPRSVSRFSIEKVADCWESLLSDLVRVPARTIGTQAS